MAKRHVEHEQLPIPNGWFAVAFSRDVHEGDVVPLEYFDEELVLFRTRSGQVKVLDPFCPHLGAHLGHGGRVMGETIRCPFHGWQFDGTSGDCTHIPYCDRIPPKARVRSWPVQEKNGMVFVWYHSEQKPPEWDFPVLEEIGHADWSEPRTFDLVMDAHVQDTHENNNDPVHFQFVHKMMETPPSEILYSPRQHALPHHEHERAADAARQLRADAGARLLGARAHCGALRGLARRRLLMFSSTTPIDDQKVHSRWLLTATSNMVDLAGEEFMNALTQGVQQDFPIWQNKVHRARPVLCEADTYLAEYRKWARQFYTNPIGDVAGDAPRAEG